MDTLNNGRGDDKENSTDGCENVSSNSWEFDCPQFVDFNNPKTLTPLPVVKSPELMKIQQVEVFSPATKEIVVEAVEEEDAGNSTPVMPNQVFKTPLKLVTSSEPIDVDMKTSLRSVRKVNLDSPGSGDEEEMWYTPAAKTPAANRPKTSRKRSLIPVPANGWTTPTFQSPLPKAARISQMTHVLTPFPVSKKPMAIEEAVVETPVDVPQPKPVEQTAVDFPKVTGADFLTGDDTKFLKPKVPAAVRKQIASNCNSNSKIPRDKNALIQRLLCKPSGCTRVGCSAHSSVSKSTEDQLIQKMKSMQFKATPLNKKIFRESMVRKGVPIPKPGQTPLNKAGSSSSLVSTGTKTVVREFKFATDRRIEARKQRQVATADSTFMASGGINLATPAQKRNPGNNTAAKKDTTDGFKQPIANPRVFKVPSVASHMTISFKNKMTAAKKTMSEPLKAFKPWNLNFMK